MDNNLPEKEVKALSVENIIDIVRTHRNDLVKGVLNDDKLSSYYRELFIKDLSPVKREFLKRDLRELLIAPIELVRYAGLITEIKETGATSLSEMQGTYFIKEIDEIFQKYAF